jgi:predicted nucleic acid-binding protein
VRLIVVDTSVVLPALLSGRGRRRKLWLLFAYCALSARADLVELEVDFLRAEAARRGGELAGSDIEELAAEAAAGRARVAERLPADAPDDLGFVASRPVLDEYERKLVEVGPLINPDVRAAHVPLLRRQIEAVCVETTDDFDPDEIPEYTPDRKDDPFVHTALLADATWLIADDKKHISREPEGTFEYRDADSGRQVSAMTFDHFAETHLDQFDFDAVDGSWLGAAYGQLGIRG